MELVLIAVELVLILAAYGMVAAAGFSWAMKTAELDPNEDTLTEKYLGDISLCTPRL